MGHSDAHDPQVLAHYEGVVGKTAQRLAPYVELLDEDDIRQVLWIKVYRALLAWDPARSRSSRDRYVFMCITDQGKDLVKRVRRGELHIEDLVTAETDDGRLEKGDKFDARYLAVSQDETYGAVEEDDVLVPSTLTDLERRIVVLLYRDYKQAEAARQLGIDKREIERAMRSIRAKMADWAPDGTIVAPPATPIAA